MTDPGHQDAGPPEDASLPTSLAWAWGREKRTARGPKRGLDLAQIVAAGIKVALTEGLSALSMARVANELGVGTMSLYRYVSSKDDLLLLMVDTGLGPPPLLGEGDGWRAGLERWGRGIRRAYLANLWALRVPITAPPLGPNNVAWFEAALRALRPTPLTAQEKINTVVLVSGFVRNDATFLADVAAAAAGHASPPPAYGRTLAGLIDPEHFPALHEIVLSGALDDDDDPDIGFEYGLQRILDGIDALISSKGANGHS